MVLHIFSNTGNYPVEFTNFTASMDADRNHIFVFRSWNEQNNLSPEALDRALIIDSKRDLLLKLTPMLKKADRVIFHSFTIGVALFYWLFAIRRVKSAWLAVYGTELYWYNYVGHGTWNRIQEWMRRKIFSRIVYVITIIDQDYKLFRSRYAPGAQQIKAFLPIPGNLPELEFRPAPDIQSGEITLLLGNSATPTNHHIEIISRLAALSLADRLKIVCPLSYGSSEYADKVEESGRRLFNDRFVALRQFLPPDDYMEELYAVDMAIMNHDRQQALGNIFTLLCMGKKIYIRGENPAFGFFQERGLNIGKIEDITGHKKRSDLVLSRAEAETNHGIMKQLLSDEHYREMWYPILNIND